MLAQEEGQSPDANAGEEVEGRAEGEGGWGTRGGAANNFATQLTGHAPGFSSKAAVKDLMLDEVNRELAVLDLGSRSRGVTE